MRINGIMQYQVFTDTVFNEMGEPAIKTTQWSERIPCFVQVASSRTGRYEDGKFIQASYVIYAESTYSIPENINRIRIEGNVGSGAHEVQGNPLATSMNRIKIMV